MVRRFGQTRRQRIEWQVKGTTIFSYDSFMATRFPPNDEYRCPCSRFWSYNAIQSRGLRPFRSYQPYNDYGKYIFLSVVCECFRIVAVHLPPISGWSVKRIPDQSYPLEYPWQPD